MKLLSDLCTHIYLNINFFNSENNGPLNPSVWILDAHLEVLMRNKVVATVNCPATFKLSYRCLKVCGTTAGERTGI